MARRKSKPSQKRSGMSTRTFARRLDVEGMTDEEVETSCAAVWRFSILVIRACPSPRSLGRRATRADLLQSRFQTLDSLLTVRGSQGDAASRACVGPDSEVSPRGVRCDIGSRKQKIGTQGQTAACDIAYVISVGQASREGPGHSLRRKLAVLERSR